MNLSPWLRSAVLIGLLLLFGTCARRFPPFVWVTSPGGQPFLAGTPAAVTGGGVDADGGGVLLRFSWGDGDTSDWVQSGGIQDSIRVSHAWPRGGSFLVTAQARSNQGVSTPFIGDAVVDVIDTTDLKWFVPASAWDAAPAIGPDGTIYLNDDDILLALNPDGTTKWQSPIPGCGPPVVGPDGAIYIQAYSTVYALTAQGSTSWSRSLYSWSNQKTPALGAHGALYVTRDDTLLALGADGVRSWARALPGDACTPPAVRADGVACIATEYQHAICAVDSDGAIRWIYTGLVTTPDYGLAIGADGSVFAACESELVAVNPDGSARWTTSLGSSASAAPTIGPDGAIYVSTWGAGLVAVSPDGSLLWRWPDTTGRTSLYCQPAVTADGSVCFGTDDLMFLGPDGSTRRTVPLHSYAEGPTSVGPDGTIYILTSNRLYAVKGSSPLASGVWPKYQHDARNSGCAGSDSRPAIIRR